MQDLIPTRLLSIIDGKIIYENGTILTIDERESIAYAQNSAQQVTESAASLVREKNTAQFQLTQQGKY